jgi:hypothetical protein
MRSLLLVTIMALLAGCASSPESATPAKPGAAVPKKPVLENIRLTLDVRYPLGQTLSLETRVMMTHGERLISTKLSECGMTPGTNYTRFTTGGLAYPNTRWSVVIAPPDEPAQIFDFDVPRNPKLGVWYDWQGPTNQIVSPMPVQALRTQPKARQELTVKPERQFGIRYQLTPWNSPFDPKAE